MIMIMIMINLNTKLLDKTNMSQIDFIHKYTWANQASTFLVFI